MGHGGEKPQRPAGIEGGRVLDRAIFDALPHRPGARAVKCSFHRCDRADCRAIPSCRRPPRSRHDLGNPGGYSRLRLTLHWIVTTTAQTCGDGWWRRLGPDRAAWRRPAFGHRGWGCPAGSLEGGRYCVLWRAAGSDAPAAAPGDRTLRSPKAQGLMCAEEWSPNVQRRF